MKYFIIISALFFTNGCTNKYRETPDYIGTVPAYANKPHPVNCECCSTITVLQIKDGRIHREQSIAEKDFHLWFGKND